MVSLEKMNQPAPKYFSLKEYVDRIKLEKNLLEHMEQTNKEFSEYLKRLSKYDDYKIIYYWISLLFKEIESSQQLEHAHLISPNLMESKDIFFDSLQMSQKRIKALHAFIMNEKTSEFRKGPIKVSRFTKEGKEEIFWRGPDVEDMYKFLSDFIEIYKSNSLSVLDINPFFKSALVHFLFVRIHPFNDGNGRTARLIQSVKFTELINKIYGMRLKISPLNTSQSILINQYTYANRINDIYFDLEHDCNKELNAWFNFILDMVDEQLTYFQNNEYKLDYCLNQISEMSSTDTSNIRNEITKMRINLKK